MSRLWKITKPRSTDRPGSKHDFTLHSIIAIVFLGMVTQTSYAQPDKFKSEEAAPPSDVLILQDVVVIGNHDISDERVRVILKWQKGMEFGSGELSKGIRRLEDSGLFYKIDISTRRGDEPGYITAVVFLREKSSPNLDWFEREVNWDGYQFNILEIETRDSDHDYVMEFDFHPFRWWSGVDLDIYRRDYDSLFVSPFTHFQYAQTTWNFHPVKSGEFAQYGYHFDVSRAVIQTGLNFPLAGDVYLETSAYFTNWHLEDQVSQYSKGDVPDEGKAVAYKNVYGAPETNSINELTFEINLHKDTRDDQDYPHEGEWFHLTGDYFYYPSADGIFDTDTNEKMLLYYPEAGFSTTDDPGMSLEFDYRNYQPYTNGWTLATRLRAAFSSGDLPFFRRFYLSRMFPMRGVAPGFVEPHGGGNELLQFSIEQRIPLFTNSTRPFILSFLFLDGGYNRVTSDQKYFNIVDQGTIPKPSMDYSYDDLFLTWGWGLAFKIPVVGPLTMSIGYPISNRDNLDGIIINTQLGLSF
ncbi:BamA/TamA family outer membrane protein [bacterium]|nr:BamA/TamA family outer membrane protein [bacterium]